MKKEDMPCKPLLPVSRLDRDLAIKALRARCRVDVDSYLEEIRKDRNRHHLQTIPEESAEVSTCAKSATAPR